MSSKQTDKSQEKRQIPEGWRPDADVISSRTTKLTSEEMDAKLQEMMHSDEGTLDVTNGTDSKVFSDNPVVSDIRNNTDDSLQTADSAPSIPPKRTSGKQRKESLEEYRQTFLSIPKLQDRKPVFISCEVRDELDEIARKLGGRRMSVSGFIENLASHHLAAYKDEVESWKKL